MTTFQTNNLSVVNLLINLHLILAFICLKKRCRVARVCLYFWLTDWLGGGGCKMLRRRKKVSGSQSCENSKTLKKKKRKVQKLRKDCQERRCLRGCWTERRALSKRFLMEMSRTVLDVSVFLDGNDTGCPCLVKVERWHHHTPVTLAFTENATDSDPDSNLHFRAYRSTTAKTTGKNNNNSNTKTKNDDSLLLFYRQDSWDHELPATVYFYLHYCLHCWPICLSWPATVERQ